MFYDCSGLTSLDLSNWNTSNVIYMSAMFYDCSRLTSLDLSNWNNSNVTYMNEMFYDCFRLTSLDLSNFNTSNVTNMGSMFYHCSRLTSLDLSNFNTSIVISMNAMFHSCRGLTTIYVSDGWNTDKVTNSYAMFSDCIVLKGDISFNYNYDDKTYAKTSGGYLTYKAATRSLKLNIDSSGVVNGYTENSAA